MNDKQKQTVSPSASNAAPRPPVVAVLGHVDHGKTTLLDTIRKSHVADREHGGITQSIGAYQIEDPVITFIDTPGHEAFSKMRSRGATIADIAILVVAADDGVMPQTKESIEQIKAAGIPLIVAMNKMDLPGANPDKVKQDLARHGVQVEGFGGDIPFVPVSAKQGTGIKELLEMISLVAQMKELSGDPTAPLMAMVVETRVDKGKGMVASVIVKQGTLRVGDGLYEGAKLVAKIRAMGDGVGQVKVAGPSNPVEVLGFTQLPQVGAQLTAQPTAEVAQSLEVSKPRSLETTLELPDWLKPKSEQEERKLNIFLKADTAGSLEAVIASLHPRIHIVQSGVGDITEADIQQAKSSKAFVVGFNVKAGAQVAKLAQQEKVIFRTYAIIYELLDELAEVVEGMKEVLSGERELGIGTIIAEFPFEKQRVAGTKIVEGRLARGDQVKIMRGEEEIGRAKIKSLRTAKEDVTKVEVGQECGVLFDRTVAFLPQDAIIAVTNN